MSRKLRESKNMVQISTYVPTTVKLQLQTLAESQGTTTYALIKNLVEEFIAKAERKGLVAPAIASDDAELLG